MNKKLLKSIISLVIILIITYKINAQEQEYESGILWVTVIADDAKPINNNRSNNNKLNNIFDNFNVYSFKQALPFAKTPSLLEIYEIKCNCNQFELMQELNSKASFLLTRIEQLPKPILIYDPSDYMWQAHSDDWLWHLPKIQANLAWDITKGSEDVKIVIIDTQFDIQHPDLSNKIDPHYDPYTNLPLTLNNYLVPSQKNEYCHGTVVASFAVAETDGGGDLASVGFNTKISAYTWDNGLSKALYASNIMGADIISISWGYCTPMSYEQAIIKEILDNGTIIVSAAGNGSVTCGGGYVYPFSGVHDSRIINVTSTDIDDNHTFAGGTHSHYQDVDICAPGYGIMGAMPTINQDGTINLWPYYGSCNGTSFATPIVAGVCALVLSVNDCLQPEEVQYIIKSTADPVNDEYLYPGLIGAGRVNAYKSVKLANGEDGIIIASGENIVWNEPKHFNTNIEIETGGILTIESKIFLDEQVKIVIKQGGKLIINGGHLTTFCDKFWQGIEVWGNKDLSQYPQSNQGVVELKNGATIENARCAITTCQKDADGNILWAYTGGIIHAKDANFINNRKAIEFLSYHNIFNDREIDNSSYFYNCTFETNAQLSDPGTLPETFVSLYDVKGVKFFGCTFQNTAPTGVYYTKQRGNGITSIDASYEVKPLCLNPYIYPCTEYQPNTFKNLYYGIDASNTNPAITLTINGNNFDNNHRSIFLKSINNATITKNNFDIGASIGNINDQTYIREAGEAGEVFIPSYSYGVYLKECSGYKVEENNFSTTHNGHAGIIVDNSGKNANEIYNNTFDNLAIGTQAQGINAAGVWIISKSSNPEDIEIKVGQGLQFLCNQYFNISSADIAVTSGRIAQNQGYCYDNNPTLPAGNKFSHPCINTSDIHVNPDASKFNYSHHSETYYVPQCYSSDKVTLHDCHIEYDSQTSCPSHLNSGLAPVVLKQIINTNKLEIEKLISLIDNGETQTLLAQIHRDEEAERIKNTLESASPYLSDRVMLAAIKEKPTPLPPDILKEIIISNSPVTDTVMSALNTLKLPDDIQQLIQEVQTGTSARAELEQQISYIVSQTGMAENDLVRQYLNDTIINSIDSVIAYLETQTDLINKKQLVQAYLVANQCEKAKILLGQLPQENNEDINFYNFYNLLSDLCVSGKTYFELTSAQEQKVREIAESETSVSVNAQAILSLIYNEKFPEVIEELKFIFDLRNAPQQGEPLGDNITKQIQFVKIYPNPAENTITLELSAELDNKNISVEIYNYLGQKVMFYNLAGDLLNTLDISDLSNGIYIFKILVGNKIIAREKVVIEK